MSPHAVLAVTAPVPAWWAVAATWFAAALALGALAWAWASTRPRRPVPGPSTMDLGDEPPAVVDLLTGGFRVADDAVPATVVDLAARGWLDLDSAGGAVFVRVRSADGPLTRYEERVLRHIRSVAVDGAAPAAALTTGPDGVSSRWWKGFVREVNRHAREQGLCRRRIHLRHLVVVWAAIGVGWVATAIGNGSNPTGRVDPGDWGSPRNLAMTVARLALVGATAIAVKLSAADAQADTDAGLAAASRWLGVRTQLQASGSFERAPAASVAIWDRLLAYATAMGLAPVVERELPFESEHDRRAWSRATGSWRRVTVRYLALRPSWGIAPWTAAFTGAVRAVVFGALAVGAWMVASGAVDLSSLPDGARSWLPPAGLVAAALFGAVAAFGVVTFALGVIDLVPRRSIEGELVRHRELRTGHRLPRVVQWMMWSGHDEHGIRRDQRRRTRYHVAIDDGTDDRVVAYQVRRALFERVRQGARVRATVSPLLGYVSELTELAPPPRTEPAVAHELVEDAIGRVAGGLTSRIDRVGERLADPAVGAAMAPALDQVDSDGVTARQRLTEAREELERAARDPRLDVLRAADGSSLLGGLLGGLGRSMERLDPNDDEPVADR